METSCCLTVPSLPAVDAVPPVAQSPEIESLESNAQAINAQISQGEQSLVRTYWALGEALDQLRPHYPRGTWEKQLARLEIEQTRAKRAMWFFQNHTKAEAEEVESPIKAYANRARKQTQQKKDTARAPVEPSRKEAEVVGDDSQPLDVHHEAVLQPEDLSECEVAAFNLFVNACGNMDRALQVAEACRSLYGKVAVNE